MSVRVIGLNAALRDINNRGSLAIDAAKRTLASTASAIDFEAKNAAPRSLSGNSLDSEVDGIILNLKQRIDKVASNNGLTFVIGIQGTQDFDAYAEFGTGQSAVQILNGPGYTSEMRAIAMTFFKNGLGTLRGRPFLFPAWIRNTANLVSDLNTNISNAIR
jgi:hypothetical protein